MDRFRYLTVQEIITLNTFLIKKYSPEEQTGVKDYSMLESAVYRPMQSAGGVDAYLTIAEKAAALFESLGKNHPFHNANKRTAFAAMVMFLKYNFFDFKMDQKEAENFTVDMVNHKYTFKEIAEIIDIHINR